LRGHKNLVFIGESGAPGGTILGLFSAISSQVWNNLSSALVSALNLWPFCCLLGQLQLNSVVFFVSAWAMDSNEVGDNVRDSRPFPAPRCIDLSLDELDVVWMAVFKRRNFSVRKRRNA
jgi:hypothetical protein